MKWLLLILCISAKAQMPPIPHALPVTNKVVLRIHTNVPVNSLNLSWDKGMVWYKIEGSTNGCKSWFTETNVLYGTTNVTLPNRWCNSEFYRVSTWYDKPPVSITTTN